jgi:hypothetical protein
MGYAFALNPGIYRYQFDNQEHVLVSKDGEYPVFNSTGNRIYYQEGGMLFGELDKNFCSVDLNGEDKRTHFHSKYANQYAVSPDGKWLAFGELHNIYVLPFKDYGQTFELSKDTKAFPAKKISDDAGINLQWSPNAQSLNWTLGANHYQIELRNVFDFVENAPEEMPKELVRTVTNIGLKLATDRPTSIIAFTGAKIITMKGDEVIENGAIVVENNRIKAVGKAGDIEIPADANVVNVQGKVIMPGMVDTHAHLNAFRYGLSPQKDWPYYANLAYGITTTHDPSSNSEMAFSQSEMVKAGTMTGPRIYTTGTILYGADGDFKAVINNYDDALSAIKRTKAYGAFSVKSYKQPRSNQRQQVIKASSENGIKLYPEGGSKYNHNLTKIHDCNTRYENNLHDAPIYEEVLQ